jgi:hypothetical protein
MFLCCFLLVLVECVKIKFLIVNCQLSICQLKFKSALFFTDLKFKSAPLFCE